MITVSISCLAYNHEKFIKECLDGFLMQQTNFNYEVIIHDDASTDNTTKIIKEYEKRYPDIIKPIYQTENQYSKGIKPTWKYNAPRWNGKYVAICEGDDYWTDPLKLQKQVDFLENSPDFIMCYTDRIVIDELGKKQDNSELGELKKNEFSHHEMPLFCPTLTRVFRNTPMPSTVYGAPGGDAFMTIYLSSLGKIKYLNFVSSAYRVTDKGIYSGLKKVAKQQFELKTSIGCLVVSDRILRQKTINLILFDLLKLKLKSEEGYKALCEEKKEDLLNFIDETFKYFQWIRIKLFLRLIDSNFIYKKYFFYKILRSNTNKWLN